MDSVTFAKKGSVAVITLNRPDKLNALNTELLRSLKRVLFVLNRNKKIKTIIMTGAGKAFSVGADISEMYGFSFRDAYEFSRLGQEIGWLLEMSEKITITAINGYALGGGLEMALATDLRVCKKDAKLGLPEAKIGLIPGFGGTQVLQEVVGPRDAQKIVEKGMIIEAKDAHKLGMVDVLTNDDPVHAALKLLKKVKTKGAVDAISCSRHSIRKSPYLPRNHIDERSRFASKFELQKTKLLMKKFLEERKIKKMARR